MTGIGSKTHDFEDIVFRRDDKSFTDVGEKPQSSSTEVKENPGQVFKHEETVASKWKSHMYSLHLVNE